MNLTNESTDTEVPENDNQCEVMVGKSPEVRCERDVHLSGPHLQMVFGDHPILYQAEDPVEFAFGFCGTCFQPLTDENRAEGVGSSKFCNLHDAPAKVAFHARNGCPSCGYDGPHERRNYDILWGEGDIHCGRCGTYVRMFDRG